MKKSVLRSPLDYLIDGMPKLLGIRNRLARIAERETVLVFYDCDPMGLKPVYQQSFETILAQLRALNSVGQIIFRVD